MAIFEIIFELFCIHFSLRFKAHRDSYVTRVAMKNGCKDPKRMGKITLI